MAAEVLAQARRELEAEHAQAQQPVWPQNWHATRVFLGMATQWQLLAGFGSVVQAGLRYEALPVVASAVKAEVAPHLLRPWAQLFAQVQALEAAAMKALNR